MCLSIGLLICLSVGNAFAFHITAPVQSHATNYVYMALFTLRLTHENSCCKDESTQSKVSFLKGMFYSKQDRDLELAALNRSLNRLQSSNMTKKKKKKRKTDGKSHFPKVSNVQAGQLLLSLHVL